MTIARPGWTTLPAARQAAADGQYGRLVRLARTAADLTLAEAGRRVGYSASAMSRIETGRQSLNDVAVLRRLAAALDIPPTMFGLTDTPHGLPPTRINAVRVPGRPLSEAGEDPVRRRDLLGGLAGATVAPMADTGSLNGPRATAEGNLETLLTTGAAQTAPATAAQLVEALSVARTAFGECRYNDLAGQLPDLLATSAAAGDSATGARHERLAALLASAYHLASELCVKLNQDALAWVLADRALMAAKDSGYAETIAHATRSVAVAMRRAGHHRGAITILTTVARDLDPRRQSSSPLLPAYGSLLCTAAYSAAQQGDHRYAIELIGEAADAATRLPESRSSGKASFSPTNVAVYKIGIFNALGDSATALRHASTIETGQLSTAERHARYCIDTARAWDRHGRPERAYQALKVVERLAPEELRRPSVRNLISSLLYTAGPTPRGLRDLAGRAGCV